MDNIQDVLKRARDEGKIDATLLPWENKERERDARALDDEQTRDRAVQLQPRPLAISEAFLSDMQRTVENLKTEAGKKKWSVLGFASAREGEGTSTLLAAAATILAGRGDNVLLLDVHSHRPALNALFNKALSPGLGELLANEVDFDNCINSIADRGLDLLTCGNHSGVSSASDNLSALISEKRDHYDWIFLDLPPVIQYAEALGLSKLCEAVILVVGANKTRREAVRATVEQLARAGVPVLGSILNRRKFYLPEGIYNRL